MIRNNRANTILQIDNNVATIYTLDTPESYQTHTITLDKLFKHRHPTHNTPQNPLPTRSAQKSKGSKTPKAPLNPQYFSEIAEAIQDAPRIIIISHGRGKSNAANHLMKHLEAHHPDVIPRIIENRTQNRTTTNQLIAQSRQSFTEYEHARHHT